ncbi:MAG: divalent-cation tolerance protein CutA [Hyphomicrobiaceae bacterium]|nr:divalent-cation tolerance protein CutA [Hyphomicrobiaceae bacterium]
MPANDKPVLIYATFPGEEEAARIGSALVEARLAACVNILGSIRSIYVWQDRRQEGTETAMLIKTVASLAEAVMERVRAMHSYDTPALLVLPVEGGSADFLAWIAAQTGPLPGPAAQA